MNIPNQEKLRNRVLPESVVNGFKRCCISNAMDGTEVDILVLQADENQHKYKPSTSSGATAGTTIVSRDSTDSKTDQQETDQESNEEIDQQETDQESNEEIDQRETDQESNKETDQETGNDEEIFQIIITD